MADNEPNYEQSSQATPVKDDILTLDQTRPCTRCKGEGIVPHWKGDGTTMTCSGCKGTKTFTRPHVDDIIALITTNRGGEGARRIRSGWTGKGKHDHYNDPRAARAYYVWRLARFHGGKDTTMPCTADMVLRSDPYRRELDRLADAVAKRAFGTDMAAAMVWGRALGIIDR